MHIPDGFIDPKTWISSAAVSAGVLGYGLRKTREKLGDRQIPTMGVMAAFIFAAQMVNFPIIGGTSGHLIGAVLAAIVLGPWAASIVMTTILVIQCLVFLDGGLTALGANVLNMAIIAVFGGYYTYRWLTRLVKWERSWLPATFIASWFSVLLAAGACALELAWSGTVPLNVALGAMLFWHLFIGLGEAIITTAIVAYLVNARKELVLDHSAKV